MTRNELLDKITTRELNDWRAFSVIEPFGPREELRRLLLIVCTILNTTPRKKGHNKIYKPDDYLVDLEKLENKIFGDPVDKLKKAKEALKTLASDINRKQGKSKKK